MEKYESLINSHKEAIEYALDGLRIYLASLSAREAVKLRNDDAAGRAAEALAAYIVESIE